MERSLLVALIFLGAGLAGCIGNKDEPTDAVATNETDFNKANPNGETLVAFEETNATEAGVGGVDHHHDMWNGNTRMLIFETPASMEPYPDDQNKAFANFRPPQGTLVYEGTNTVEFTLTLPQRRACPYGGTFSGEYPCTDNAGKIAREYTGAPVPVDGAQRVDDPNPPVGLKLRYKHASTVTWIDAGELVWNTPTIIKMTDPRQTDMPHATSSLWEFQVESPNAQDVTLTFTAKAEAVRGEGDIPLWPGHPNFYADRASREVLNVPDGAACDQSGCTLGSGEFEALTAQKLISYGTKTLHVWINISEASFPVPATQPQSWFLYHNNATGRDNVTNQFDAANYGIEKRELYWVLPVDENGMDSPYADGSRWTFDLGAALVTPVGISCYGNCADWYAKYTMVVHATNEELPLDAYHNYCLRDEDCTYAAPAA